MTDTDDDDATPENRAPMTPDPVAALVAAGEYVAAARLAAAARDLPRAISLYERAWRFADALQLARVLGDRPLAIRLALDAGDGAAAAALADEIPRDATEELRGAAGAFAARGKHWEAARMAERAGDFARAAGHFRRAGDLLDLGRMEERAGRPREAGIAYEQALADAANAQEAAAAHLALGRLLAQLGRHRDAARALQQAIREPAHRLSAGRALTSQLLALGFRVAAAEIVRRLRSEWSELPESAEALAALEAADASAGTSAVGQVAPTPGLLRHRFKVLRSLGAGATSHVYLAEDTLLGQAVALKLLSVGTGARGLERQAYARFTREAEAAGRLRHPNIVGLHDSDPTMGLFVLELMPGGTLADRLAQDRVLSPFVVRRLALDLLSALGAAHEAGMVHRDVKPANILFDAGGNAKLADFGAAHLVDFGQTQTGGLLGTVAYMSPEQISGGTIGPAADLYALAVTLFEALTGRLPFPGPDIIAQHLTDQAPRASAARAETLAQSTQPTTAAGDIGAFPITEAHDSVLLRALRKAPSERWRSAAQMADVIRRAWPVDALGVDVAAVSALFAGPVPPPPDSTAPNHPSHRDLPLARSQTGRWFRRDDLALGRPVLVEVLDRPLDDESLARLQALAALGGPHVQRVLALSVDGKTITYELCEGPRVSPGDLSPQQAGAVAEAVAALDASGVARPGAGGRTVIMTSGGPVVLVVDPVPEADAHQPSPGASKS